MKVLLCTPPAKTEERWPPLGLLYIASSLADRRGDEVSVLDAFCLNMDPDDLVSTVEREKPDILGMNCSTHMFLDVMRVVKAVKSSVPDIITVLGGYHATFTSSRIMNAYEEVDYIIRGEGETVLPNLLDHLESGTSPHSVRGLTFREGSRVVQNEFDLIEDLDALPFPDRHLVKSVEYGYAHQGIPLTFGRLTTICSSRGCPYNCTYCSCASLSKRRYRKRSPESVVEELRLIEDQGYEICIFVDDNFTLDRKRVLRICELIRENDINLRLYAEGRVDRADPYLMRKMKGAGFDVIYFGAESASQRVLDYYKKGCQVSDIRDAMRNARRAGLLVIASFILGAPVEEKDEILRTLDFINETVPHAVQMNILDCLVGTPIWEELEAGGLTGPDDWRTNHRIYEYPVGSFSREELEHFADQGYIRHLRGWKNPKGIAILILSLLRNRTLRDIAFHNLTNAAARKMITKESEAPDES